MREIVYFLYQKSQNKFVFWFGVILYVYLTHKFIDYIYNRDSDLFSVISFSVFIGMAPVWGYAVGKNGPRIGLEKKSFKKNLKILESSLSTQEQKNQAGERLLNNPECDQDVAKKVLQQAIEDTYVYNLALEKLKKLNPLITKP